ncbi:hypothetical protein DPEC_G00313630 [Dallia pectoralis]|uniref:Uncharacterized protein n=1 Tax=Dallia pectoralis TaxID=75939 RepID=A0ACC2FBT0_DALPE|nr:hypothetical protein DPEC_G00313630 [Dallia pectoralis]
MAPYFGLGPVYSKRVTARPEMIFPSADLSMARSTVQREKCQASEIQEDVFLCWSDELNCDINYWSTPATGRLHSPDHFEVHTPVEHFI